MPNRIIRDDLLESDRYDELPTDTHRLTFVHLLLLADDLGNIQYHPRRLLRRLQPLQIDTVDKLNAIMRDLTDVDLIRFYEVETGKYLHVPRFRQRVRYIKRACPLSPWQSKEEQRVAEKKTDCGQT